MEISQLVVGALGALVVVLALVLWRLLRGRRALPRPAGLAPDVQRVLTDHARQRMAERDVSEARLMETLLRPDAVHRDDQEQSYRFDREFPVGPVTELVKVWVSSAEEWPPRTRAVVKSTAAQRSVTLKVGRERVGRVIGRRGATISDIRARTGAKVFTDDDGRVTIVADRAEQALAARDLVRRAAAG